MMTKPRAHSAARGLIAIGALGCLIWSATGSPVHALRAVLGASPNEPAVCFDELLSDVAGLVAWLCLCWLCLVVALQVSALGSGAVAHACRRLASHVTPRFMLAGTRWLLGATLIAGPLTSGIATAAQIGAGSAAPSPAAVANLDRPAPPDLDRPAPPDLDPPAGPDLDRPAPSFAGASASSQLAPPARSSPPSTPAPPTPLLIGSPHRETPDRDGSYVVRRGDTLWDIAARHLGATASAADIARAWPRWYTANQSAIGPNPQLIHPGLVLHAPPD